MVPERRNLQRIFGVPALLGLLSAAGLLSALLGDNLWDALSWIALSAPIAVALVYVMRGRARGDVR
ncbi:MAG: hypothetical protein GEU91_11995 [Rhizobiales bacterium]|nr:hypothetical protein [Hyphomicrobiales bacterium]